MVRTRLRAIPDLFIPILAGSQRRKHLQLLAAFDAAELSRFVAPSNFVVAQTRSPLQGSRSFGPVLTLVRLHTG